MSVADEKSALRKVIADSEAFILASLDAVCVVTELNQVVYANPMMRSFLGLKPRDIAKSPVFCDCIKLSICKDKCQVKHSINVGEVMRFDEVPGTIKGGKLRVNFKVTPIKTAGGVLGAIICMRDTTAELLTQAKYTKLSALVKQKDELIEYHKDLLRKIRSTR